MRTFWSNHKTKILGGFVSLIGYLQLPMNAAIIGKSIGPDALDWLTMFFGGALIVVGIVNGGPSPAVKAAAKDMVESGKVRAALLATLLSALLTVPFISGCSMLGVEKVESPDDAYTYVMTSTTAVRESSTESLRNHEITADQMEYAISTADRTRTLADTAKGVADAGDEAGALRTLAMARTVLDALKDYLRNPTAGVKAP